MICDHCKTPIERGEPYSITEHGRLHSRCLRLIASPHAVVSGPLARFGDGHVERHEPIFVLQRA